MLGVCAGNAYIVVLTDASFTDHLKTSDDLISFETDSGFVILQSLKTLLNV